MSRNNAQLNYDTAVILLNLIRECDGILWWGGTDARDTLKGIKAEDIKPSEYAVLLNKLAVTLSYVSKSDVAVDRLKQYLERLDRAGDEQGKHEA